MIGASVYGTRLLDSSRSRQPERQFFDIRIGQRLVQ
jgi:hypothetical protein